MLCRPDQNADVRLFLSDKKITLTLLIVKWFFCISGIIKTNIKRIYATKYDSKFCSLLIPSMRSFVIVIIVIISCDIDKFISFVLQYIFLLGF